MKAVGFAVAAAALAAACQSNPQFPSVRDVRPTSLEVGDVLVVELAPEVEPDPDAPTRVVLVGAADGGRDVELTARISKHRALVDVDDHVAQVIGGRMVFDGQVRVDQRRGDAYETIATTGDYPVHIEMFRPTARRLAHHLFGEREGRGLAAWLGVDAELAPDGSGLLVRRVRGGFEGIGFLRRYDCGRWRDGKCVGGPDGKVHLDEAKARGFTDEDTFRWADLDGDGVLTRHEILDFLEQNGVDTHEDSRLPPSPAAAAGVRAGDILAEVDGKPTPTFVALYRVWHASDAAKAAVTIIRDGGRVSVEIPRYAGPQPIPTGFLYALILVAVGLLVVLPVPVLGGLIVVWERKISGRMQSRPGPNRVGPNGWLQWLADGLKLIVKEDVIPREADPVLFRASPLLVFSGVFLTFVVLPFSPILQVADFNVGILYILSVTSIVVVGVIMGGWASNSKWSLLGGMRSAAQIISYELPASIAVLSVVIGVGSLSMQDLVKSQGAMPWEWNLFASPFSFACFFIFFISALAEGNRTPFDLPEAESELVSGYNTEYSGFRFSIFALAEWVNLIVIGAVTTTVFLGGWNIPFADPIEIENSRVLHLLAFGVFAIKVIAMIFVCIWIRWTLPRFRVDHMMNMCWKYFLPIALASLIGAALWTWLLPDIAQTVARVLLFVVGGLGIFTAFLARVNHVRKTTTVWELRGA
ncbi:MAG: NADH-quinone oxidoreductase subunit NuoH [Deltaproteobacteria bacterium]|nr:MAG: NADH-quinone oxidoreductase subunit NuoH [Deltaproteobacteria bacterium]